jgi:hypothetical protein
LDQLGDHRTRFPPAEASGIIARRQRTELVLPWRTICCSRCPSWSVGLRTRTRSATAPPALGSGEPMRSQNWLGRLGGVVGDQVSWLTLEDIADPRQGREADGLGPPVLEYGQVDDGRQ